MNATRMRGQTLAVIVLAATFLAQVAWGGPSTWSAARIWDEQLLAAIRISLPRPPVHARNLYHTSVAMWDAWAAYDPVADGVINHEKHTAPDVEAARHQAISYAAYRVIKARFLTGPGSAATQAALDAQMDALGYDKTFTSTEGVSPAALGNRIAAQVLAYGMADNSNNAFNYAPNNGYSPVNPPLIVKLPGLGVSNANLVNPNRWQPLAFDYFVTQNGIPIGASTQAFVCPHWRGVKPFALRSNHYGPSAFFDPGPPPTLGGPGDAAYRADAIQVIRYSSWLDPTDGVTIDISPGAMHNNPLGTNNGTGHPLNPVTGQSYEPNVVLRGDYRRAMAEFWADGPESETPPGHWHVLANHCSEHPMLEKRIAGKGPIVNDLEWDVKVYLAISGAAHDAAIGAWGLKGTHDSARPITMIRYMGHRGQSSDPQGPSYHPQGLPLVDGLVSVITKETIQPGGIHEHIPEWVQPPDKEDPPYYDDHVGDIAIFAWRGEPDDPETEIGGVGWIWVEKWMPYQKSTFVTPPFAGYTSGHSTFSRATAEALAGVTGSPFFPGGLSEHTIPAGGLAFEAGPDQSLTLTWATFYDCADEAGISRIYGGIHPNMDDLTARVMGSQIGLNAWEQAQRYFNGTACPADIAGTTNVVNVEDLLMVIGGWGACVGGDPCFEDVVANGTVNVQDLLFVVGAWGACQ